MLDLYEFETDLGEGDGGAPEPEPTPEPAPEPEPEPEAWAGPTQEEWQQTQAQLAQANEFFQILQSGQAYQEPQQAPDAPEFDMFDPDGVRAHDQWLLEQIRMQNQQMLAPMTEQFQNQQAEEWAESTFEQLGVPEGDLWRNGVLFASAGFSQDAYGNPVHPYQAAQQGYQFLRSFAEAERAAGVEEYKKQLEAENAALKERVESPDLPSGPAGGEGAAEWSSLEQATRAWLEKDRAASG